MPERRTHLVEQEGHDRGRLGGDFGWEVKRSQEERGVEERGEEREDGENVQLGDGEQLGRMHVVPVTKLMCQDSFDFFRFALFDECIEDDDMFGLI